MNSKMLLTSIFVFTLFSLVVFPGYRVFISDQELYFPQIYQSLNPELFQNDFLLGFNQTPITVPIFIYRIK